MQASSEVRQRASAPAPRVADAVTDDTESNKAMPKPPRSFVWRWCAAVFPAPSMPFIWLLVAANYVAHMVVRENWWNFATVLVGHAVLATQIVSFARAVHTHPGSPPPGWEDHTSGTSSYVEGVRVPPRAYYVKRTGTTVLGFDHHCWWLGCAVGWRNRKFFVLFVLWSAALAGFAAVLTLLDIAALVPYVLSGSVSDLNHEKHAQLVQHMQHNPLGQPLPIMLMALAFSELNTTAMVRASVLSILCALDVVSSVMLGVFGCWHLWMVRRNRTTLEPPGEEEYDMGGAANMRQVMGTHWWLWALPTWGQGDGPYGDGMAWPRRRDTAAEA